MTKNTAPISRPRWHGARLRLALTTACLPLMLSACAGALQLLESRPTARVTGARLTNLSLSGLSLGVDVEVTNSLPVAVPVVGLDWALATSGEPFLRGATEPGGSVPASGTRTIALPVDIVFSELLSAIASLKPGDTVPYAVDLGLSLRLPSGGDARLPLRHTGTIPVPTPPSVSVSSVDLEELSFQTARGVARLEVGNRNSFPLDLSGFTYGLELGSTKIAEGRASAPKSLAAGGTGTLEIPLDLSPISLGAALFETLSGGRSGYTLDGALEVGTPFGPMEMAFGSSGETTVTR